MSQIRSVCVFCGSRAGLHAEYRRAAEELGASLARERITLVYGGGNIGLMGLLADAVLAGGGSVVGVIPRPLVDRELAHSRLSELHVVHSMHARKELMAARSDAVIALPGGIGTLEELCEMFTWSQLGIHRKPVAVLNTRGFFGPLLAQLGRMETDGFLDAEVARSLIVEERADRLLGALHQYTPPPARAWLGPEET